MKVIPGSLIRALKPFRLSLGRGPKNDGLCMTGDLFVYAGQGQIFPLGELLRSCRDGRAEASCMGTYSLESESDYGLDGEGEFWERTGLIQPDWDNVSS